mmetsp:Transcript_15035/g.26792  ORF Transcript_15035/g.26792 Transcript_15035/m.26792 type:complete len:1756 (-) Transcript_15035:177-5444(-)
MSGRWSLPNLGLSSSEPKEPDASEKGAPAVTQMKGLADLLSGLEARKENMASSPNSPNKVPSQSVSLLSPRSLLSLEAKKEGIESRPLEAKQEPMPSANKAFDMSRASVIKVNESKPVVPPLPIESGAPIVTPRGLTPAPDSRGLTPVPEARVLDVSSLTVTESRSTTPTPRNGTPVRSAGPITVSSPMDIDAVLKNNAPMSPRKGFEINPEVETDRLLRWEQQTQQVDKEQTELMLQQQRLFREQVSTLSGEALQMRNEIKELARVLKKEQAERSGAIDKVREELEAERMARSNACHELHQQLAQLQSSTEDGLRTSANLVKEQFLVMEKVVRENEASLQQSLSHLDTQLGDEVKARIAGDSQQENLCQKASEALQQLIRKVESQLVEEKKTRLAGDAQQDKALEEKFACLRTNLTELASVTEVVKNNLELESTERTRVDKEMEDKILQSMADLQALKKGLDQETANRLKGDENTLDFLRQSLESEVREREELRRVTEALSKSLSQEFTTLLETRLATAEALIQQASRELQGQVETEAKARAAAVQDFNEKCAHLRAALAETASDAAFSSLRKDLEREVAERKRGKEAADAASKQLLTDIQSQIEQELKNRVAGDKALEDLLSKSLQNLQNGLENESADRQKCDNFLEEQLTSMKKDMELEIAERRKGHEAMEAASKHLASHLQNQIQAELKHRIAADKALEELLSNSVQALKTGLDNETSERQKGDKFLEEQLSSSLQVLKTGLDNETAEREKGDKVLEEQLSNCVQVLKTGLDNETAEREKVDKALEEQLSNCAQVLKTGLDNETAEREKGDKILEDQLSQAATKADLEALKNGLDMEATERGNSDKALQERFSEQFVQLRPFLEAAATKDELQSLSKSLDEEKEERMNIGKMLQEQFSKMGAMLSEAATKDELQALKNFCDEESAERAKGVKTLEEQFVQALKMTVDNEMKERMNSDKIIEDKILQLRPILAEFASKTDLQAVTTKVDEDLLSLNKLLENEMIERANGDEGAATLFKQEMEALIQQMNSQLEQEAKARTASDVELEERFMKLGPLLSETASKAELNGLKEALEGEAAARAEGDKDTLKQQVVETALKELSRALQGQIEQEVNNRIASDDKTMQILAEGLEKAGSECSEIVRAVESTEGKIMQSFTNLLDEEAKLRAAGDQQCLKDLEDKFMQLRPLLSDFAAKADISSLRGEFEDKFVQLHPILAETVSKSDFSALRADVPERISGLRTELEDKFSQFRSILTDFASKSDVSLLRDDLQNEARERAMGDENMMNVMKQESGDRERAHTQITRSLEESHTSISRSLESHLTGYSQGESERGARFMELQSLLDGLTRTMNDEFRTLRNQLESEERARTEGDGSLEKRLVSSYSMHVDSQVKEVDRKVSDLAATMQADQERSLTTFKAELDGEKMARQSEDAMLKKLLREMEDTSAQQLQDLLAKLEIESSSRSKDRESIISECGSKLNDVVMKQSHLEHELVERIKMIIDTVQHEKQQRQSQVEKLESGLQNIPVDVITQQLKDLWAGVESEATQRKAGDETLEKSLHNSLEIVARKQADQDAEWQRSTKRMLDEHSLSHKDEIAKTTSALHNKIDDERSNRTRSLTDITEKVVKHEEQFGVLVREMASRGDEASQQCQELMKSLEREKNARMEEHAALRRGYESTASELERNLHTHKQDFEQQLFRSLELRTQELADRHEAMDRKLTVEIERTVEQHNVSFSDMKEKIVSLSKHMDAKVPLF